MMTIAMGLKQTHAASVCWRTQVEKENRLKDEWNNTYRPDWEAEEAAVIERVREREEEAKREALARPERALLLDGVSKDGKGRVAYLKARNQLNPTQKSSHPLTASQAVGWQANKLPEIKPNDPWKRTKGATGGYRRPVEMEGMF